MENFTFYEVGGCVRDSLLGLPTKDVDFSVVAQEGQFETVESAFAALEAQLLEQGFKVFESKPEYQTIRAQVPAGHPLRQRVKDADFVLARKDGPYSDGRRPDYVLPGSLEDDIFRRDYTANALARTVEGDLVDLVGGQEDLGNRVLRFVGKGEERVQEDGLRVVRGLRFMVTKGLSPEWKTWNVLTSSLAAESLGKVAVERIREELVKMLRADTLASLRLLYSLPVPLQEAIFRDGLRLDATLAK
jgi:tRNA nucleotidyltransferase (CCA-adding enzyme)